MNKYLEAMYANSPVWVQQLGINAFGWYWARRRLGAVYESTWREYAERESWPEERMREYVEGCLRKQMRRACREVPHYRAAFVESGLGEKELERFTVDDLRKLPLLEKSTVRAGPERLLTKAAAAHPPASFATSGTTGTPIRVFWDSAVHQHNLAVREARSFRWAGVSYRSPRSAIGGRLIVPKAHNRPPFWRYNHWEHQLYLSAFHISAANVSDYADALNRYRPVTMTGYASGNFFLARFIGELGLQVHSPGAVITSSEALEPHMRATLESVFRCRAYQEYGSVENCLLATECERGRMHVNVDFGWVEILRADGTPAPAGEVGEVVATGFANTNQIFIRYRIGDLASWSNETCPCGRSGLPVLERLVGRQEDTVVTQDGREMVRFHGIFVELPGVVEAQVIQETLTEFVVNVVASAAYTAETEKEVRKRMTTRLGPDVQVRVCLLDTIPREANGKYRAVMSRVQRKPPAEGNGR